MKCQQFNKFKRQIDKHRIFKINDQTIRLRKDETIFLEKRLFERMISFLNLHCPLKFKVEFKYFKDDYSWSWGYAVTERNAIFINLVHLNSKFSRRDQGHLLHEIGHLMTGEKEGRIESEIAAHCWALDYAKSRRMNHVYRELIYDVLEWRRYGWNENRGHFRAYIKTANSREIRKHVNGFLSS